MMSGQVQTVSFSSNDTDIGPCDSKVNDSQLAEIPGLSGLTVKMNFNSKTRLWFKVKKKSYKWPQKPDTSWIREDEILSPVREPVKLGKTTNMFKVHEEDIENIANIFGR